MLKNVFVTGIDIDYETIKIVTIKIDQDYKFKNIKVYKEISLAFHHTMHTYLAIIKPYCKNIVVIGSNGTRIKTIHINFSKFKNINNAIYSLNNIIFAKNKCLFNYYINYKKLLMFKNYFKKKNESRILLNIIFQKDFDFYFKFFHILKNYKTYIISRDMAIFYMLKLINTKNNNIFSFNTKYLNIVYLNSHEVNICTVNKNKTINTYSLYYSNRLNYIDIVQKFQQLVISSTSVNTIVVGAENLFLSFQKHLHVLLRQKSYHITINDFKPCFQKIPYNFILPITYVYFLLDKKKYNGIIKIKSPIKVLSTNTQKRIVFIYKNIYMIAFIGALLLIEILNYTSHMNIMNFINSICFIEIMRLIANF